MPSPSSPASTEKLGLPKGTVRISAYAPEWQLRFEEERSRLQGALGDLALDIRHVGSTSVPDLDAKPVIDIAIAIPKARNMRKFIAILESLGYLYHRRGRPSGEHSFELGRKKTTYQVYLMPKSSQRWRGLIAFRDRLAADPTIRSGYCSLKRRLAKRFPDDPQAYADHKAEFIREVLGV